jgi:hypothetical protein
LNAIKDRAICGKSHSNARRAVVELQLLYFRARELAKTSSGEDLLAGKPSGLVRGEKDRNASDVFRLTDAAERGLVYDPYLEVSAVEAGGMRAFGDSLATGRDDGSDNFIRAGLAGNVVYDYRCAFSG